MLYVNPFVDLRNDPRRHTTGCVYHERMLGAHRTMPSAPTITIEVRHLRKRTLVPLNTFSGLVGTMPSIEVTA